MQLHTAEGARKYLTPGEREAFLKAAGLTDADIHAELAAYNAGRRDPRAVD